MVFDSLFLAVFYLFFLFLQILIVQTYELDTSFLKRGQELKISGWLFTVIVFLFAIIIGTLSIIYFKTSLLERLLYFYTFLFISGLSITFFLVIRSKNILLRCLLSLIFAVALVSFTLSSQEHFLKNIVTAGSLLWISPILLKNVKINKVYMLIFLGFFTAWDIFNVFILNPNLPEVYKYALLNGYVDIGHKALGTGDFFFGFLAAGFIWFEKGPKKSVALVSSISLILLTINLIGLKYDIPFSFFILIPTLFIYFWGRT